MRSVTCRPVLVAMLIVGSPATAERALSAGESEIEERFEQLLKYGERHFGFSGTVLAARDGKVVARAVVGHSRGEKKFPINDKSLFEIGSTTKAVTAIALFQLRDAGRLNLDHSISKYLPNVPEDCRGITVRHLLQHTSGIPGTNIHGAGTDFDAVLPLFLKGGPQHTPGTHGEYWNQGYSILSEIIARVSGQTYVDYCRDRIFKPAGMTASCFNGDQAPAGYRPVTGDSSRGAPRSALEHPYGEYGYQYRGMGGMVTTAADLWRLDRALADGRLLTADSVKEMTSRPRAGRSAGWHVSTATDGATLHHHAGSVRGFLADLRRYPHVDGCLVITWNSDTNKAKSVFGAFVQMCEQLLLQPDAAPNLAANQTQMSSAPRDGRRMPLPPLVSQQDQRRFSGRYRDSSGRVLLIIPVQEHLRVVIVWDAVRITPGYLARRETDEYTFHVAGEEPLKFAVIEESRTRAMRLKLGPLEFQREE